MVYAHFERDAGILFNGNWRRAQVTPSGMQQCRQEVGIETCSCVTSNRCRTGSASGDRARHAGTGEEVTETERVLLRRCAPTMGQNMPGKYFMAAR